MLERRNPVPPGRYWLDVFAPNISTFTAWTRANKGVRVVSSEFFDSTPPRQWVLFDVVLPVDFDQKTFGFPTVVTGMTPGGTPINTGVQSSADTVDRGTDDGGLFGGLATSLNLSPEAAALVPLVVLGIAALAYHSITKNKR